ncbi:MAG: DUF6515 family protein [Mucilaginibacter sp.]
MAYKKFVTLAFSGLLGLFLALPASAQHRGGGGGGGGRSSGGGGGGFSRGGGGGGFSRPSGGGNISRPSGGVGVSRPSGGGFNRPSTSAVAPQRGGNVSQGGFNRGVRPGNNGAIANNNGFQNRGSYGRGGFNNGISRGSIGNRSAFGNRSAYGYRGGNYGRNYGRGSYGRGGYGYRPRYYGSRYFGYGFYNYRGYYNSYYLPRIGFSIGVLPFGYYPFFYGDYQYYYSDGLYYQQLNNQYTVVEPPIGAAVNALPSKAEPITINGEQYYESNGVYYRAVTKDDGTVVYEVAGKDGELNTDGGGSSGSYDEPQLQVGDVVKELPDDSRKIKVNGEKLYVSPDGTYFQEQTDADNNKVYKVVGLSGEEPDDDNQQK